MRKFVTCLLFFFSRSFRQVKFTIISLQSCNGCNLRIYLPKKKNHHHRHHDWRETMQGRQIWNDKSIQAIYHLFFRFALIAQWLK